MNMFFFDEFLNNTILIDSLRTQENNYASSGEASSNNREFGVGFCQEYYNGLKVLQLHQRKKVKHFFFGPFRVKHEFEGDIPKAIIIGWKITCRRNCDDNYCGSWRRLGQVLGTNHFQFLVTSCFMRDLDWELNIYYICN